jgi:DNA-directed RNA polymerase specialized sigma24 family protein
MVKEPDESIALLRTLRLVALIALRGMKQKEQVDLLDQAGYAQSEIADMLNSTPKAISVRLAEVRKVRRAKGR